MRDAGLHRLTVSLDTLHADRFRALTRSDEHGRVLDGIAAAAPLFPGLKLDTVVIRGVNDDELVDLIEFGRQHGAEVRFIEYMDVGGATALVDEPGGVARRDAGGLDAALRADHGAGGGLVRAGRPLPAAGWDGVRDHRLDDRAVLPLAATAAV